MSTAWENLGTLKEAKEEPQGVTANRCTIVELDPRGENECRPIPVDEIKHVVITRPEKKVKIKTQLPKKEEQAVIHVLASNVDLFAWSPGDMPWIDIEVACHRLAKDPEAKPSLKEEENGRRKAPGSPGRNEQTTKIKVMIEIKKPTWLSNVVLIKKNKHRHAGRWDVVVPSPELHGHLLRWKVWIAWKKCRGSQGELQPYQDFWWGRLISPSHSPKCWKMQSSKGLQSSSTRRCSQEPLENKTRTQENYERKEGNPRGQALS